MLCLLFHLEILDIYTVYTVSTNIIPFRHVLIMAKYCNQTAIIEKRAKEFRKVCKFSVNLEFAL